MVHTPAEQLFMEMFYEALSFTGDHGHLKIDVLFDEFPCRKVPHPTKSGQFYPPMIPVYEDNDLLVVREWVEAVVEDKLPTCMRSLAYYYAYGFHIYNKTAIKIESYPMDRNALSFAYGLILLNGIPIDIPPYISRDMITGMLSRFTNKNYMISDGISADGRVGTILCLSDVGNKRLQSRLEYFESQARTRKLDVLFGTKNNPFENIDEAIAYIEFLEKEAVANDLFLNSDYNKDRYRYDIGFCRYNGKDVPGGLYKIPWASAFTAHVENSFPKQSFVVTQLASAPDRNNWIRDFDEADKRYVPLFALKPNLSRRRFLFRGQNEEYKDKATRQPTCKPNLYRPDVEKNPLPHRIKAYEMACLVTRHPLVRRLGIEGVEIFNEPFRFQLNRLGLAQHYYNKTSFLDLTSDIEVAKFFATSKYDWDNDSYDPYYSEKELGVLYIYDMRLPEEFRNRKLPRLSSIGKQYVFLRSAMQSGFLLDMPPDTNLHDLPNVYRIYFKHDRSISEKVIRDTKSGEKYFPKDALSRYWKKMYKAPNSDYTISLKAREMYLKFHPDEYSSVADLDRALVADCFQTGDNVWPEFPEEILADYYKDAPSLWKNFCADIFFLGSEGHFMKNCLENLIYQDKYKDTFFNE